MRVHLHLRVTVGPWFFAALGIGTCLAGWLLAWQLLHLRQHWFETAPPPTWPAQHATQYPTNTPTETRVPFTPTPLAAPPDEDDDAVWRRPLPREQEA